METQEEMAEKAVRVMSDYVNTFGSRVKEFNFNMANEHRTLQQSFTKLCLAWIEYCASEDYRTDGRNEATKLTAQKLLKGWELQGETHGMPPSNWLPLI
jgi:hypothetical protein